MTPFPEVVSVPAGHFQRGRSIMIAPFFDVKKWARGRWWPHWLFPVKTSLPPTVESPEPSPKGDDDGVDEDFLKDIWGEKRCVETAPDRRCRRGEHDYDDPPSTAYTSPTPAGHVLGHLAVEQQWRICQRPECGNKTRRFRERIPNGKGFSHGPWKQFP